MAKKILVVDDSKNLCKIISVVLESEGFEVVGEAGDGDDAMAVFKESMPDVVTLDLLIPGLDAAEVIKKMKRINPKVKIFVISALVEGSDEKGMAMVLDASRAGADEFLSKPFNPSRLIEKIRKLVGK